MTWDEINEEIRRTLWTRLVKRLRLLRPPG